MVDMSAVMGLASSLRAIVDITKAMKDVHDANLIQSKIFELMREIMAAQSCALEAQAAQSELLNRIRDLEAEKAELETWNTEKKRYNLTDFGGSTFAYSLKPEEAKGEPLHRICATCYQQGKKSILQFTHRSQGQEWFKCHGCRNQIALGVYKSSLDLTRSIDYDE